MWGFFIYNRGGIVKSGERMDFSIIDNPHGEEKGDNLYLTQLGKLNSKWIKDLSVKGKIFKL